MKENLIKGAVALLRDMVRIPSVTFSEDAVCTMIAARLLEWGLPCVRYGNNLTALKRGSGPRTLVLDAHIDTVPAAQSYTRDPLDPGDDADTVWGLGRSARAKTAPAGSTAPTGPSPPENCPHPTMSS